MSTDPRLRERGAVALCAAVVAAAAPSGAAAAIAPVRQCGDLKGTYAIAGAVTHVTSAEVIETQRHCDVSGFVEPAVKFQLELPLDTFTGRYLQYGCDGYCGWFAPPRLRACGGPRDGTFAVAATDDGHVAQPPDQFGVVDATWAAGNRAARDDFFFRAPHVVSKASKRIVAAFYGSPPRRSYFNGCSTGGREGLLLAQRYPRDFDGIVAGAPTHYFGPIAVNEAWVAKANLAADGSPVITKDKLAPLHDAVVRSCDRRDGLADGQIEDPRACRFDPASLQCARGADRPDCLTPAQVAAARKLYAGATDARGRRLYPASETLGSELAWDLFVVPLPGVGAFSGILADGYLKYMAYPPGTPHSSPADFRFTVHQLDRLTAEGVRGNAMSLDLREFRRAGGKLLLWHGWADASIPPGATADYYERLTLRNHGLRRTRAWARLFMVPTLHHCAIGGGYELNRFDPFDAIVPWVERGRAPDRLIAYKQDPQGHVLRSRPVFPYPLRARYDGSGSIDSARNFVPARPLVASHPIRWAGEDLFARRGPSAP
jgi:feruloyl esterase